MLRGIEDVKPPRCANEHSGRLQGPRVSAVCSSELKAPGRRGPKLFRVWPAEGELPGDPGAQKAGTTALDHYLRQHPEIGMADVKRSTTSITRMPSHREPYITRRRGHFPGKRIGRRGEVTPITSIGSLRERIHRYNPAMKPTGRPASGGAGLFPMEHGVQPGHRATSLQR